MALTESRDLPLGTRQKVEIVKILLAGARILIFDEPTSVLAPQEVEGLFTQIDELRSRGYSVLMITHKLREARHIADRVTVLRGGHSLGTVDTAEATPRSLAALMVGRELDGGGEARARTAGEPVLQLEGIWTQGDRGEAAVKGASLVVRAGEIVAVAGVAGNGQRELAETIAGMRAPTGGSVRIGGKPLRGGDPRTAIAAGIAYVPEDRLGTGVSPSLSIASNLVLRSYRGRSASRGPLLRLGRIREHAIEMIRHYRIAAPGPAAPARLLSGGNLQKVVLAREFSGEPRLLVAAAPTRGLDVGAIETVHAYLREAAAEGVAVLLISEDLDEILLLADRIAVMYEGAIVGETARADASVEELGLLMAGGQDHHAD
jgi:simple sugar transport system ATP-binding protein